MFEKVNPSHPDKLKAASMDKAAAYRELFRHRQNLTKQQFRTISGQINSGDAEGAVRGLEKLTRKGERQCQKRD